MHEPEGLVMLRGIIEPYPCIDRLESILDGRISQ